MQIQICSCHGDGEHKAHPIHSTECWRCGEQCQELSCLLVAFLKGEFQIPDDDEEVPCGCGG